MFWNHVTVVGGAWQCCQSTIGGHPHQGWPSPYLVIQSKHLAEVLNTESAWWRGELRTHVWFWLHVASGDPHLEYKGFNTNLPLFWDYQDCWVLTLPRWWPRNDASGSIISCLEVSTEGVAGVGVKDWPLRQVPYEGRPSPGSTVIQRHKRLRMFRGRK